MEAQASERLLDARARDLLVRARRATLATTGPAGQVRLIPICYWLAPEPDADGRPLLYSPLDEKPKAVEDMRSLARVRDILARPTVSLLVDRWDEDWERLAWLRLEGQASLLEPEADAEPKAGPGTEPEAEPEPEAGPRAEPESEAEPEAGPGAEPESEAEPEAGPGAEHAAAVAGLRGRYRQYRAHHLETRPLIRIVIEHVRTWSAEP